MRFNFVKVKNLILVYFFVGKGVWKMGIVEKVVGLGLKLGYLKKIFEWDGEVGFWNIFLCKYCDG